MGTKSNKRGRACTMWGHVREPKTRENALIKKILRLLGLELEIGRQ